MKLRGLGPLFVACGMLGLSMVVVSELLKASGQGHTTLDIVVFWFLTFWVASVLRVRVYRRNGFGEVFLAVILGTVLASGIVYGVWMGVVWLVNG
jgi:hypothetical protein